MTDEIIKAGPDPDQPQLHSRENAECEERLELEGRLVSVLHNVLERRLTEADTEEFEAVIKPATQLPSVLEGRKNLAVVIAARNRLRGNRP